MKEEPETSMSVRKNPKAQPTGILKTLPLFSCLEDRQLQALSEIVTEKTYPINTLLMSESDASDSLFVIFKGRAQVAGKDAAGRAEPARIFEAGDCFDEMSFIDGKPRPMNVETLELTRVLVIPGDRFRNMVRENTDICFNLLKGLLTALRKSDPRPGAPLR